MAWWRGGVVAWWRGGVVAWWRGGVVAWWRGGVVAWWRGGVVAWWRGRSYIGLVINKNRFRILLLPFRSLDNFGYFTVLQFTPVYK